MKHLKMLGLLVVAAASLMAFASSASAAPTLTYPQGTEYTGEIHATLTPNTSALLKAGIEDTCTESTVKGKVEVNNEEHAEGKLSVLSFPQSSCTKTTDVLKNGSLTLKDDKVTAIGNEVTVFDLGVSCVYGGSTGTVIGTLTEGEPAELDVSTTELPKISGGFLCASKGTWTGSYIVTSPAGLWTT